MKKFSILISAISVSLALSACTSVSEAPQAANQKPQNQANTQSESKGTPKDNPSKTESASLNVQSKVKEMSKSIEVIVEGSREMRPAALTKSSQSGYEFYLLDNFSFEAEEPGKDIIFSKYDKNFFVRIEKLDKTTDLNKYKLQQMSAFKSLGQVTEMQPSSLFHQSFQDAAFCFITESQDAKGLKTSILYLAKTYNNEKFAFTFFMPLREAAEGITPSFWAMLNTLEIEKDGLK